MKVAFGASRDFRCIVPTNIYGPDDNFDEMNVMSFQRLFQNFLTRFMVIKKR